MDKNLCAVKNCPNHGKYARYCGHISGHLKEPKAIAPRSKKLSEVMKKEYVPQVKEMVEKNTPCRVKSPVCTGRAQGFHHLVGRLGKELTGKRKVPCCDPCNSFLESNDAYARAHGWKLSKFNPEFQSEKIYKKAK